MILGSKASCQTSSWGHSLRKLISTPAALSSILPLDPKAQEEISLAASSFPLRIPEHFANRIASDNPEHPALKQYIPQPEELQEHNDFSEDPVGETQKDLLPGLLHKYNGRVLMLVSSSCPIHCRYCFRRHFPYDNHRNSRSDWERAINYVSAKPDIHEVIFSGGDPFSVPDKQLAWLSAELAKIPHLSRLRIHTRYPVVMPERITEETLEWLTQTPLSTSMVIHCNHSIELDDPVVTSTLGQLKNSGVTLLNQSVLLKGVNDNLDVLKALSEQLFQRGVLPYYLHQLDRVQGAAHFEVSDKKALELHQLLQTQLPGYLVPRLVREEAGRHSKSIITGSTASNPADPTTTG